MNDEGMLAPAAPDEVALGDGVLAPDDASHTDAGGGILATLRAVAEELGEALDRRRGVMGPF